MADVTPDPIKRIASGYMAAKHLFVASAIGLEKLAGGPATLDELATKCGVPRRTSGISIDAITSLGARGNGRRVLSQQRRGGGVSGRHAWPQSAAAAAFSRSDQPTDCG
jgi:hypothetical protein